jgi:predicted RNA-binding Zn-ribbon protein involved in translation (DUF1610 family)
MALRPGDWRVMGVLECPSMGCGEMIEVVSTNVDRDVRCPKCMADYVVRCEIKLEPGGHPTLRSN